MMADSWNRPLVASAKKQAREQRLKNEEALFEKARQKMTNTPKTLRERYQIWAEQAFTKPFARAAVELEDLHREALDQLDEMQRLSNNQLEVEKTQSAMLDEMAAALRAIRDCFDEGSLLIDRHNSCVRERMEIILARHEGRD